MRPNYKKAFEAIAKVVGENYDYIITQAGQGQLTRTGKTNLATYEFLKKKVGTLKQECGI